MRAFETEKTDVAEVDRSIYDIKDKPNAAFEVNSGLTPEIVEKISEEKNDPEWMRIFRQKSLRIYNSMPVQNWGPSIEGLDMSNIVTYVRPKTEMRGKWSEVPDDIKNTFERLGIPKAERASLAGVGAQYDSEVVYHNVKAEVAAQGVVYTDIESALNGPYAEMVRTHFMKLVPPTDHKFAALHGAVWSGGSFVYVPAGVSVEIPLQSYFRLNAPGAGQFEHTLIIVDKGAYLHFIEGCSAPKYNVANLHAGCVEIYVGENARVRYSTIENWSKNMYNLNTKRAKVEKGGTIEWVSGSFGSHTSCLYPMSILAGEGARMEFTGITFAGAGQDPLQSYFRLNAPGAGQFEHTLIIVDKGAYLHFIEGCSAPKYNVANLHAGCVEIYVGENARVRYSTIENWSKNMYNLNTKRAKVEKGGTIEWVSGSFGSHTSCLYPMSILAGEGARMEFTGITFAGAGQDLDTGAKVVHAAPNTSSHITTKSIARDGGVSNFRSSVTVLPNATGSKSAVSCESLMLDDRSRSDTIPEMDIRCDAVDVGHEAKIGRISEEAVFYLMSRGLSEEDARALIVGGFAEPIAKELPVEYAVEMNNLIHLEMKGSIG